MKSNWDCPPDLPPPEEWLEQTLETKPSMRWPHRGMTRERWVALDSGNNEDGPHLTKSEIAAGWHFCVDWDGLLTNMNDDSDSDYEFCNCKELENG